MSKFELIVGIVIIVCVAICIPMTFVHDYIIRKEMQAKIEKTHEACRSIGCTCNLQED